MICGAALIFDEFFDFCFKRGDSFFCFCNLEGAKFFYRGDLSFDLDSEGIEVSGCDLIAGEIVIFKLSGSFS